MSVPHVSVTSERRSDDAMAAQMLTWVPVDVVAAALIDMSRSDEPVFHLSAPQPVPWHAVFSAFAQRLGLPLVPYAEWVVRVSAAAEANTADENVPAFALLDFFRAANFGEDVRMSTTRAVTVSRALAEMRPLGEEDAFKYLGFWKTVGHVKF
jgi:hypothetical protein